MVIDREKLVVEIRSDLLIPGYYSNSKRKGQVPCEVNKSVITGQVVVPCEVDDSAIT